MNDQPTPAQPAPPASDLPTEGSIGIARPTIVVILYLLNFAFGFTVLVGVVLAYVWRGEAATAEWERTHYTYHIRTFWLSLVVALVTGIGFFGSFISMAIAQEQGGTGPAPWFFALFVAMMVIWLLVAIWFTVRCIMSLARVGAQQPMPRPRTWLF